MLATSSMRFADCEIDPSAYEVRRAGQPCAVEPQVFELLVYLARNPGRLVTKDELIANVWGGRIVSDAALSSRIKSARRAIGDDGEQQRLIKTVHGRGVRFIAQVAEDGEARAVGSVSDPTVEAAKRGFGESALPWGAAVPRGRPAVTVLPMRAAGEGAAEKYLAETITEEIVTCLARDRTMSVLTRPALVAADATSDGQNARTQDAGYVIDGSVRCTADRMILTVRLLDAASGSHIWAERCERPLHEAPSVDERLVYRISAIARGEIDAAEARSASALADPDGDPWALYHLGLRELYRFTPAGLEAARGYFEHAVALNPNFASAMARLAYVRIQEYWYGPHCARDLSLTWAEAAANRALELDPRNALGHFALGRVHALRGVFDLAVPAFETALGLNPSLPQIYFGLGQATFYSGRPKEALEFLATAIELDPHDPHLWSFLHDQSDAYYALGLLDDAARSAKAASCLPNATHWPLASLTAILGSAGQTEAAREALHGLRARLPQYSLSFARTELAHHNDKAHIERFLDGLKAAGLPERAEPVLWTN